MDNMDQLTYEEAYQRLETIITQLESGELTLEQSVAHYEMGKTLSAHCQKLLESAELKIKQVDDQGNLS